MSELPRRNAHGQFVERPVWLRPGWAWVREIWGPGGPRHRTCTKEGCSGYAMRGSDRCVRHDSDYHMRKNADLIAGLRAPTPNEAARLYRTQASNIWRCNPWLKIVTIWFAPRLEERFVLDCRHLAGLNFDTIAPVALNTLRWAWLRSRLNHDDPAGWQRALKNARSKQRKIGPPPRGYAYEQPSEAPPADPRVRQVLAKAPPGSPARRNPAVDRETRARLRRESTVVPAPPTVDIDAIVAENWPALRAIAAGDQRVLDKIERHRGEIALALIKQREGDFEPWLAALAKLKP